MAATGGGTSVGNITIAVNTVYNGKAFERAQKDIGATKAAAAGATSSALTMGAGFQRAGKSLSSVGKSMSLGITAPLLLIGTQSFKTAHEFQTNMNRMTSLAGITRKEMESMKQPALDMASKYGIMGTKASEALYFIASSGFDATQSMKVLEASMMASATGMGEVQEIADLVTSGISAYGKQNLNASQAVDIMAVAIREGKMESDEMAKTMGSLIPIASELDISFADTAGAMAIMSRAGADAFKGATQLRGIMGALLKPSVQGAEALAEVGLSAQGLRNEIKQKGLYSALMTIRKELGNNKEALAKVFPNVRGLAGFLNLMGKQAKNAGRIMRQTNQAVGEGAEAFKKIEGTQQFKYEKAIASLKNAMIELGIVLTPIVTDIANFAAGIANAFSNLPKPVQSAIVKFGVLAALMGPFLIVLSSVVSTIGALTVGYGRLTAAQIANTAATRANAAAMAAGAAGYGLQAGAMGMFSTKAGRLTGTFGRLGVAGRGLSALFGVGGPWGLAIAAAMTGLVLFGDEIVGFISSAKNADENIADMKKHFEASAEAAEAVPASIQKATDSYRELANAAKEFNQASAQNKKPDTSVGQLRSQAKGASNDFKMAASYAREMTTSFLKGKAEADSLATKQLNLVKQANLARGTSGMSAKEALAFNPADIQRQILSVEQGIKNMTITSVSQLDQKLKGLTIPPKIRNELHSSLRPAFMMLGQQINEARVQLGKLHFPPQLATQAGKVLSEVPNKLKVSVMRSFAAMKPAVLNNLLPALKRVQLYGSKRDFLKILPMIDPKKADGGLKQIQAKAKNMKIPPAKVDIQGKPKLEKAKAGIKEVSKPRPVNLNAELKRYQKVKGQLDELDQDRSIEFTVNVNWEGKLTEEASLNVTRTVKDVPARAYGGPVYPNQKTMPTFNSEKGYKASRPMFMVGEENRTEFVIATNPAYRENNIKYWAEAGKALGIPGFKEGGIYKSPKDSRQRKIRSWSKKILDLETILAQKELTPQKGDDIEASKALKNFYLRTSGTIGNNRKKWRNSAKPKDPSKNKKWKNLSDEQKKKDMKKYKNDMQKWYQNNQDIDQTYLDYLRSQKQYEDQIKTLREEMMGEPEGAITMPEQLSAFSSERLSMLTSFAGNIRARAMSPISANPTSVGGNSNAGAGAIRSTMGGAAGAGTNVSIVQNYQEPPKDPHAWTRELQNQITATM